MSKINQNDSAYPTITSINHNGIVEITTNEYGLSVRAELAARAMQAIVSSIHSEGEYWRLKHLAKDIDLTVSQWIAKEACKQADALIAELNK